MGAIDYWCNGFTPEYRALWDAVIGELIARAAAVNPRDRWGRTPIDEALRHGHHAVAERLGRAGAVSGGCDHVEVGTAAAA